MVYTKFNDDWLSSFHVKANKLTFAFIIYILRIMHVFQMYQIIFQNLYFLVIQQVY